MTVGESFAIFESQQKPWHKRLSIDTVIVDVNEDDSYESISEDEQDWEELSRDGGDRNQELDEEPVELNSNSQAASVTDVQSMQSSSAEFDELSKSETENKSWSDVVVRYL